MADAGWTYHIPAGTGIEEKLAAQSHRRAFSGWGWDDTKLASTIGYGILSNREATKILIASTTEMSNEEAYIDSLGPETAQRYSDALLGSGPLIAIEMPDGSTLTTRTSGCLSWSRIQLYGSIQAHALTIGLRISMPQDVLERMSHGTAYLSALDQWRSCMSDNGYEFSDPLDAFEQVFLANEGLDDDEFWELESAVATQDALCATNAGLADTGAAAFRDAVSTVLNDDQSWVTETVSAIEGAILTARTITGEAADSGS